MGWNELLERTSRGSGGVKGIPISSSVFRSLPCAGNGKSRTDPIPKTSYIGPSPAPSGPSPPRPSSPTSHPPFRERRGTTKADLLYGIFSLPSLPAGGREVGERGRGSEGPEAAQRSHRQTTLSAKMNAHGLTPPPAPPPARSPP